MHLFSGHFPQWILNGQQMQPLSSDHVQRALEQEVIHLVGLCQSWLDKSQLVVLSPDYLEVRETLKKFCNQLQSLPANLEIEFFDQMLSKIPKKPHGSKKANKEMPPQVGEGFSNWKSGFEKSLQKLREDLLIWPRLQDLQGQYARVSQQVFERYLKWKTDEGQYQMQDLEILSFEALRLRPELAKKFSEDWDYWLIDEYQDTSPLQDQLIERLKGKSPAFYVGDPQQSIYLFRGSRFENFQEKEAEFKQRNYEVTQKDKHYRSRADLMHFFNDLFSFLDPRYMRMLPQRSSFDKSTDAIEICFFESESKSSEVAESPELLKIQQKLTALLTSGVPAREIAILARTSRQLRQVYDFLKAKSFPVQLQSNSVFETRREILDLGFLLRFFLNPHDNENLVALLRTPWFRIPDSALIEVSQLKQKSLWKALQDYEGLKGDSNLKQLQNLRKFLFERSIGEVLQRALSESGLLTWSRYIDSSGRREANIWKWLVNLKNSEKQPGFNYLQWLAEFQWDLDLEQEQQEGDAHSSLEPNRIQLMTVHASKGLEFEQVIVPFCGESRTPPHVNLLTVEEQGNLFSLKIREEESQKRVWTSWALKQD
ncbi:MAG: UvrD-helicase domain-containing protein, partial [Bdellovibrionales bacterium]|nr:UvrD-helicase domain-containing protein [Bdellovibrionales bacterium]